MVVAFFLGYVASAAVFYAVVAKRAPLLEEPAWVTTGPPEKTEVVEMFPTIDQQAAA
jgi:hypothetical protein